MQDIKKGWNCTGFLFVLKNYYFRKDLKYRPNVIYHCITKVNSYNELYLNTELVRIQSPINEIRYRSSMKSLNVFLSKKLV